MAKNDKDEPSLYELLSPSERFREFKMRGARNIAEAILEAGSTPSAEGIKALMVPLPSEIKREELKKEKEQQKTELSQNELPRSALTATSAKARTRFWILYDLIAADQHLAWKYIVDACRAVAYEEGLRSTAEINRRADTIQRTFMSNEWHESARTLEDLIQRVQEIGSDYGPPENLE